MASRIPPRYGYALAGLLLLTAGVFFALQLRGATPPPRPGPVPPAKPTLVAMSFPPPPAADLLDGDPTPADDAHVERLLSRLSAADVAERERALVDIEGLPYRDLPLLESAATRPALPPVAAEPLVGVMPRIRSRDKLARRRAHARDGSAAFYERQAMAEYAAGGHTNPKWDAAAQTFLHLATVRYALHRRAAVDADLAEANRQLQLATTAGCDDPTVLACAGQLTVDIGGQAGIASDYFTRADHATGRGPLFGLITDSHILRPLASLSYAARGPLIPQITARLCDMTARYRQLLAVPGLPPAVAIAGARDFFERLSGVHYTFGPNVAEVYEPLSRVVPADDPRFLATKGWVYTEWAWEARGGGYASSVTPQGRKDFAARLDVAAAALIRSYELDPGDPAPATEMLIVVRGQQHDRIEMEQWYRRAMDADPDDADAAAQKLEFLKPKWGGDAADMVPFGRACLAQGNWRTRIPTVLALPHQELADVGGDPAYWLSPGVWDDLRAVYGGYLS
jgi:hypothetical protein